MTTRNDAAPSAFAEAARTAFIYAPILGVVGAVLFSIGGFAGAGFFTFMGAAAYVGAAVTGLVGIAGMIREGQTLLARQHEAAGLAIASYQRAAKGVPGERGTGGVGGPSAEAAAPQAVPYPAAVPAGSVVAPHAAGDSAPVPTAQVAVDVAALGSTENGAGVDVGQAPATDVADFVGLLKSLYILDAARDVRRLYGDETCASFVNRKCADNGMSHVNLTGADIPESF